MKVRQSVRDSFNDDRTKKYEYRYRAKVSYTKMYLY